MWPPILPVLPKPLIRLGYGRPVLCGQDAPAPGYHAKLPRVDEQHLAVRNLRLPKDPHRHSDRRTGEELRRQRQNALHRPVRQHRPADGAFAEMCGRARIAGHHHSGPAPIGQARERVLKPGEVVVAGRGWTERPVSVGTVQARRARAVERRIHHDQVRLMPGPGAGVPGRGLDRFKLGVQPQHGQMHPGEPQALAVRTVPMHHDGVVNACGGGG